MSLRFSFDGRAYHGRSGDTLASALLANGVRLMGRSFKYHRPRGVLAAGSEEPNALVEVDRGGGARTPNLRATTIELYDGLVARSQNRFPSLAFDVQAINDLAAPLLPAGFYYKTFIGPQGAWARLYEPIIRRAAGLGRAPDRPDPDHYASRYAHCDVLVIGSGPAGLAAAETASASGARVMLCDEQPRFGGSLLADRSARLDGASAPDWVAARVGALAARPEVVLLTRTTAFGWYPGNMVGLAQRLTDHLPAAEPAQIASAISLRSQRDPDLALPRERLWQVRAKQVVIAAGAIERPLVFPGNDRPGVMLADAVRTYAVRYGTAAGRRAVIVTTSDTAYRAALDLKACGVDVALVADLRAEADGPLPAAARLAGIRVEVGMQALQTRGRLGLRVAIMGRVGADGRVRDREWVRCDVLGMSGGWTPSLNLFSQARGKLRFDRASEAFLPGAAPAGVHCAGACQGVHGLADVLADGTSAGAAAACAAGFEASMSAVAVAGVLPARWAAPAPSARPQRCAFVDFQNDVTSKDLKLAAQEGFRSIEHVKRYTTTGMATDQGKTSNMNALSIVAGQLGAAIPDVGLTTFRPPYTPVTFGTLAAYSRGVLFDPVRTTPIHGWAASQGAVFEDVGLWKRARYYPRTGEGLHAATARECRTVRSAVGLFDASTLGKIEVVGPDAAEFMNPMYVNAWAKMAPGRCRYGLMLGENGFLLDDGVVGRLAADRFHVTTTTGGAPRVLALMEDYLQTEWPDLQVWLTSITEQWAVLAVQGPRARDVLAPLVDGMDIGAAAMPHMSVAVGYILGVPMRLFRVSFTGELGFEVNVPAGAAEAVWKAVHARIEALSGCVYGTEAMHVLRAEKGYVIVGQESDGTVTLDDLGLGWAVGKAKRDFVGRRSLARPDMTAPGRRQLVGLRTADPGFVLDEGAQVTEAAAAPVGTKSLGWVTSAYGCTTVGHSIALAMIADGRARRGELLHVQLERGAMPVRVVDSVFLDPEGARLDA